MNRDDGEVSSIAEIPENTLHVLASCHSLVCLDDTIIGDPLEKAVLQSVEWRITKGMRTLKTTAALIKVSKEKHG